MAPTLSPAEFMQAAPAALSGSSPWAARYASELRQVVHEQARNSARTLQRHLGPSELGVECDRQVVGKLAGLPETNHVSDPWPSVVGTALHAWLADAFSAWNGRHELLRFLPEQRVSPHPEHPGTGDLYDAQEQAVVDHKCLGTTSLEKVRRGKIPRKYYIQIKLYGLGFRLMGLPVRRLALAAYPRTKATLDDLYVHEIETGPQDDQEIAEVFTQTDHRKALAQQLLAGGIRFTDVPTFTDDDECFFCPFYRPQSAHDNGTGCPGPRKITH